MKVKEYGYIITNDTLKGNNKGLKKVDSLAQFYLGVENFVTTLKGKVLNQAFSD